MNSTIKPIILAALMITSVQVMADDAPRASDAPKASANKDQSMKDCMAKQKATNSSLTQSAMETVCKNQVSSNPQKNGNDLATGPQSAPPKN